MLKQFKVDDLERKYRFWQRDPLAYLIDSPQKAFQKVDYIHYNPLKEKWKLVKEAENYQWSIAIFYATGEDNFGFLTPLSNIFVVSVCRDTGRGYTFNSSPTLSSINLIAINIPPIPIL